MYIKRAKAPDNSSLVFLANSSSNQPAQVQILARILKLNMKLVSILYFAESE